jgi:hypothetical protein
MGLRFGIALLSEGVEMSLDAARTSACATCCSFDEIFRWPGDYLFA